MKKKNKNYGILMWERAFAMIVLTVFAFSMTAFAQEGGQRNDVAGAVFAMTNATKGNVDCAL